MENDLAELSKQNTILHQERNQTKQELTIAKQTINQLEQKLTIVENNLAQERQNNHNFRQQLRAERETNANLTQKLHQSEQNYSNLQAACQNAIKAKQTTEILLESEKQKNRPLRSPIKIYRSNSLSVTKT